ncbi:tyrosine-type recombinase/integrase [Chloroflexota bacterium]
MVNKAVDDLTASSSFNTTNLRYLVQGYILSCRCEGKSPATIHYYEGMLRRFLSFCNENHYPQDPQQLTSHLIWQFLWYVASESTRWNGGSTTARKPATMSTVAHYYRVLHTFFMWLVKEGIITDNPMAHIKRPKDERKVVQALTPYEIRRLLDYLPSKTFLGVRNRAIVMMLIDTGMRVSELANLMLADIDNMTGSILVRQGKGNKQRIVRIGSKSQKALWQYATLHRRGNSDKLFTDASGEPLGAGAIKLMIRRLGKMAGLDGVHVHRLRHTFAISYLRAGGDVFSLQYLLGHSTLAMTQRYLQSLNADGAIKAHKRFSPLDNLK